MPTAMQRGSKLFQGHRDLLRKTIKKKKDLLLLDGVNLAGQILMAVDSTSNLGTDPPCSGHKAASERLLH